MSKRWKSIVTMKSSIVYGLCYFIFFKQFMFYLIELCIFKLCVFTQNTVPVLNKSL